MNKLFAYVILAYLIIRLLESQKPQQSQQPTLIWGGNMGGNQTPAGTGTTAGTTVSLTGVNARLDALEARPTSGIGLVTKATKALANAYVTTSPAPAPCFINVTSDESSDGTKKQFFWDGSTLAWAPFVV